MRSVTSSQTGEMGVQALDNGRGIFCLVSINAMSFFEFGRREGGREQESPKTIHALSHVTFFLCRVSFYMFSGM